MPRTVTTLSDANWVLLSAVKATFTIEQIGKGQILFNDVQSDVAALVQTDKNINHQIRQTSDVNTYVRSTESDGDSVRIIVDEDV